MAVLILPMILTFFYVDVSNLQSNGLCSDYCRGKYVFAITSHENCWCSNYEPAQDVIVSNSECNFPCLGFPYEFCGGNDLYGYLNLGAKPSGTTDGAPSATPSSSVSFPASPGLSFNLHCYISTCPRILNLPSKPSNMRRPRHLATSLRAPPMFFSGLDRELVLAGVVT